MMERRERTKVGVAHRYRYKVPLEVGTCFMVPPAPAQSTDHAVY